MAEKKRAGRVRLYERIRIRYTLKVADKLPAFHSTLALDRTACAATARKPTIGVIILGFNRGL